MTLSTTILQAQEIARRLIFEHNGSVLPYDEDLGGFSWSDAIPEFVTTGTAAERATITGSDGDLFYETNTSVLVLWTSAGAWRAVAAPGTWTSSARPAVANTDATYEGLRVLENDTGHTIMLRRTTLGTAIGVSNVLVWMTDAPTSVNPVRNPSGAVAQRGTSVAVGASGNYTLDAWTGIRSSSATGSTVSQQAATATVGAVTAIRYQRDSGNASTARMYLQHAVPTVESKKFANRQVTVSFQARKLADYSSASSALEVFLYSGTGTDQQYPSAFTGQATVGSTTATLTTSFQTFTFSGTPGSSITQLGLTFTFVPVGTASTNDAFEIKDVRIDVGPVARPHIEPSYPEQLAVCQRFFFRTGGVGSSDVVGVGLCNSAVAAIAAISFPQPMRAVPSLSAPNASAFTCTDGTVANASSAVSLGASAAVTGGLLTFTTTGLTTGRACLVYASSTSGYLDFSAEI